MGQAGGSVAGQIPGQRLMLSGNFLALAEFGCLGEELRKT